RIANYLSDDRADYRAAYTALSQDLDFNAEGGRKADDLGETTYLGSRHVTFAAIGIAALLCGGAGAALIFGVARPVQATGRPGAKLAGGGLWGEGAGAQRKGAK